MFSVFWPLKLATGLFRLVLNTMVFLTCILTVMAFIGSEKGWLWSLTSHFRMQYLVIQLIALFVVSLTYWRHRHDEQKRQGRFERWLNLVFLGFFAGLNLVCIAPYYLPSHKPAEALASQDKIKLMHFNVFGLVNHQTQDVIAAIREQNPDVIDLVEYVEPWRQKLESSGVLKRYPYRATGAGHIALYSKRPLKNTRLTYAGKQRVANQANVIAQFTLDKEPITILVAHPASPIMPSHLQWLQESFATWEQERNKLGRNLIIVGDLNTSPWSREFKNLTAMTGLRDSQLGYGIQPSWPMLLPMLGVRTEPNWLTQALQIPIDHVLVSERLIVFSRQTGPFVGSDHLPVIIELGLRPKTADLAWH